jgi:RNA polymerase sigma-70 factor, ECF subfamily
MLLRKESSSPPPAPAPELEIVADRVPDIDYVSLVARVQANEPEALEELYAIFSSGIRLLIIRAIGRQDLDDRLHDIFLAVVSTIQKGELRDPSRLMGYVRVVVKRQIATYLDKQVAARREQLDINGEYQAPTNFSSPEAILARKQNAEIIEGVMRSMSRRDREVLTRFYLMDQSVREICAAMDLNETQFRLLKSRAKRRFAEEGQWRIKKSTLRNLFLRTFASETY